MRKFKFKIYFVDVATGNYWIENDARWGWTYNQAVKKALWRGQVVLRGLNKDNKNIFMRVCKVKEEN